MHDRIPPPGTYPLEATSSSLNLDSLRRVRRPAPRGVDLGGAEMQPPATKAPAAPVAAV